LAKAANLSTAALNSIERGRAIPRPATAASIQRALEDAGAQFIPENGGGAGVRLRKSKMFGNGQKNSEERPRNVG
jgi:hypothetical protein